MNEDLIIISTESSVGDVAAVLARLTGGRVVPQVDDAVVVRVASARLDVSDDVRAGQVLVGVDDDDPDAHRVMGEVVAAILGGTDWGVETLTVEDDEMVVRQRRS